MQAIDAICTGSVVYRFELLKSESSNRLAVV